MEINKTLKVIFILSAVAFLVTYISVPKTNCQACTFEYEEKFIDGYEAFEIFEEGCIDYKNPHEQESNINITELIIE